MRFVAIEHGWSRQTSHVSFISVPVEDTGAGSELQPANMTYYTIHQHAAHHVDEDGRIRKRIFLPAHRTLLPSHHAANSRDNSNVVVVEDTSILMLLRHITLR